MCTNMLQPYTDFRAWFAWQWWQCRSSGRRSGVAKCQSTIPLQWHTVHSENRMHNCIEVTIATGHCKGSDVFLPWIPLTPSDANITFGFKRLQISVRVCFAMLINNRAKA